MPEKRIVTIAEFSIHPIGEGTSVGRYVKAAIDSMQRIKGLRCKLTPMATVMEAEELGTILRAVEASHTALRKLGAKRISSSLRIDERLDRPRRMEDKVRKVEGL